MITYYGSLDVELSCAPSLHKTLGVTRLTCLQAPFTISAFTGTANGHVLLGLSEGWQAGPHAESGTPPTARKITISEAWRVVLGEALGTGIP